MTPDWEAEMRRLHRRHLRLVLLRDLAAIVAACALMGWLVL